MKLHVITDSEGNIVATSRMTRGTGQAPSEGGLIAKAGQSFYEIEVPEQVGDLDAALLHWRYSVEVRPSVARLIELGLPIAKP